MIKNALKRMFVFLFFAGIFFACTRNDSKEIIEFEETIEVATLNPCPCEMENYLGEYEVKGKAHLFHSEISDLQQEEMMKERMLTGHVAWIVFSPTTDFAVLNILSEKETSTSTICNFEEYANFEEYLDGTGAYQEGMEVYYEGIAYETGRYLTVPPHVGYNLVLTLLKKH